VRKFPQPIPTKFPAAFRASRGACRNSSKSLTGNGAQRGTGLAQAEGDLSIWNVSIEFELEPGGVPPGFLAPLGWAIEGKVKQVLSHDLADLKHAIEG
jgi:hypothetical protein